MLKLKTDKKKTQNSELKVLFILFIYFYLKRGYINKSTYFFFRRTLKKSGFRDESFVGFPQTLKIKVTAKVRIHLF